MMWRYWFYMVVMIAEKKVAIAATTTAEIDGPILAAVAGWWL